MPRTVIALVIVAAVSAAACTSAEDKARAYIASGDRYVESKQYAEAALQYSNALQQAPR